MAEVTYISFDASVAGPFLRHGVSAGGSVIWKVDLQDHKSCADHDAVSIMQCTDIFAHFELLCYGGARVEGIAYRPAAVNAR